MVSTPSLVIITDVKKHSEVLGQPQKGVIQATRKRVVLNPQYFLTGQERVLTASGMPKYVPLLLRIRIGK